MAAGEERLAAAGDGTVSKALEVLDHVAAYGRPVRFGEVLDDSRFPKATLYRFMQTLTKQGMLQYDPDRQTYSLGVRLVRLAHSAWAQSSLAPIARPYLDELSRLAGETVHLAQLDGGHVLYVDKRNAVRPVHMYSEAGKVGPAYCTGVGKAMLAFLPPDNLARVLPQQSFHRFTDNTLKDAAALLEELQAIRACGHAFDNEEHEPGIICVAVPILTNGGRVLGGLSLTSTVERTKLKVLAKYAPELRRIADCIAREAVNWRFPEVERPNNLSREQGFSS